MADENIRNDRTNTQVFTNGATDGEFGVFVSRTGSVAVRDGSAITGSGGVFTVTVNGLVQGRGNTGVSFQGQGLESDTSNAVYVGDTGRILGRAGIAFETYGSTVFNEGLISASQTGIRFGGQDTGEFSTVRNFGTIEARTAIRITEGTTEGVSIANEAGSVIRSTVRSGTAIDSDAVAGLGLRLENGGLIAGSVRMGGTDDAYFNTGGRVRGTIYGEGGDDTFAPGRSAERINGGAGTDTLDFSSSDRVTVTLGGMAASNTGPAKGDSYVGIERVFGSLFGRDDLRGSASANLLDGQGGNDRLAGGRGNDLMVGGAGRDVLTGGRGSDAFQFNSASEGRDRIADFGSVAGNDDRFRIDNDGFGGSLAVGTLANARFDTGRDNIADDANDRFIFRTTDRTLWFDTDGSGSAGPVLIADLQAGANVAANDILIF